MTAAGGEAEVAQSRRAYFDILHQSLVNVSFAMLSQLACCQGCIRTTYSSRCPVPQHLGLSRCAGATS